MRDFSVQKLLLVAEETVEYVPSQDVTSPEDIRDICIDMNLHRSPEEIVSMFTFNAKGKVLGYHEISHGTISCSVVNPRDIFKRAMLENASSIALVHNHPSDCAEPSKEDILVTKRVAEAGRLMEIDLLDHLIITPSGEFLSLRKERPEVLQREVM